MSGRRQAVALNPSEVALDDRPEINLHEGAIQVGPEGIDWGQVAIDAWMAERRMGQIPVDYKWPNRVISIPLIIGASGDFEAARIALQAEAGRINEEGGWLKHWLIGGSYGEAGKYLFADLVKADFVFSGGTEAASHGLDTNAQLTLEALPDFYGEWIHEAAFEVNGAASKAFQVIGSLPARGDLTVTDKSGVNLNGCGWFTRCRYYDAAETARWRYEAEALTKLDAATEATLEGASGGKAISHGNLATNWTPILGLQLKSGTYLTHQGVYDVIGRVYSASPNPPWLRLVGDVGDGIAPDVKSQVRVPGINNFYELKIGQLNLRTAPFGPHRWLGAIYGRGLEGGENVYIDTVELFCVDEGSAFLHAPRTYDVPLSGYKARDRYLQPGGALTGKTAEVGGKNYSAITNSDTTDFEVNGSADNVKRTATVDTGTISGNFIGRAVGLALGLNDQMAEIDWKWSRYGSYVTSSGLMVRASSPSNFVRIFYSPNPAILEDANSGGIGVEVVRGGVLTVYGWEEVGPPRLSGKLTAGVIGDEIVAFLDGERIPLTVNTATGSAIPTDTLSLLPSGGVYLADECQEAEAMTREYDNLTVWVPDQDAVAFANRSARIAHQGAYRQDATGTAYGPVAYPGSDNFRIPVSGPEERPVEVGIRPSRGDFLTLPDSGLGLAEAQVSYRPCWSQVPGL